MAKPEAFPIETNVPIPPLKGRPSKYPFDRMGLTDSFFIPGRTAASFSGTVKSAHMRTGSRYTMRTEPGGVRVWRVE